MTKGRRVKATLRFDGGHRRGIDKAAYGFTLTDAEGNLLVLEARAFGYTTHNVAEYRGMIAGLLRAAEIGVTDLQVWGDSRVVINQMTGASRARAEHLAALRDEARRAALKMNVAYEWNRRNENAEADALVNLALDACDVKPHSERPKKPHASAKGKKSAMADLSRAELRSYLLEHITVSDKRPGMRPTERLLAKTARRVRPTSAGCWRDVPRVRLRSSVAYEEFRLFLPPLSQSISSAVSPYRLGTPGTRTSSGSCGGGRERPAEASLS